MEAICKFISTLGLKGECPLGLIDAKHVMIWSQLEEDYSRLFLLRTWFIQSSPMTISKWTIDFTPHQESSITLLWVLFLDLSLHFFNMTYLHKIAFLLGWPLHVDKATKDVRRPFLARVLIELDVAKSYVRRVCIGHSVRDFWQKVEYELWPDFYTFCERIGHVVDVYFRKNLELHPTKANAVVK